MTAGQNIALPTATVVFTARSDVAFDVSVLITDTALAAASPDDFVFYNQPRTAGVRLAADRVEIDLDAVRAGAGAVLCIVSADPALGGTSFTALTAALHDGSGSVVAEFEITCAGGETAVICWELYRRGAQWKVRAVGQGYADGLAGLLPRHGVDVDDAPGPQQDQHARHPGTVAGRGTACGPDRFIEPLDHARIQERFEMILEDGARSAAAYAAARSFAESRLDDELSAAVADPAARNSPASEQAKARAQGRHDDLVAQAHERYVLDSDYLRAELDAIAPALPRSFASWDSQVWTTGSATAGAAGGVRVGAVSALQLGPLQIPYSLPFPFARAVRIVGPDTAGTAEVTSALALRMLAADPDIEVDVVDLNGKLADLSAALSQLPGAAAITEVGAVPDYLEAAVNSLKLAVLDRSGGGETVFGPRLLILNHFPFGYSTRDLPAVALLAEFGPRMGMAVMLVVDEASLSDPAIGEVLGQSFGVPAQACEWRDPWTGNPWTLSPDRAPAGADTMASLVLNACATRNYGKA